MTFRMCAGIGCAGAILVATTVLGGGAASANPLVGEPCDPPGKSFYLSADEILICGTDGTFYLADQGFKDMK